MSELINLNDNDLFTVKREGQEYEVTFKTVKYETTLEVDNNKEDKSNKVNLLVNSVDKYPSCKAVLDGLNQKQDKLYYVAENAANKSQIINTSTVQYPSCNAVYEMLQNYQAKLNYTTENVANKVENFDILDNDTYPTTLAVWEELQKKQDITAYPPEDEQNKSQVVNQSTVLYPSCKAVYDFVWSVFNSEGGGGGGGSVTVITDGVTVKGDGTATNPISLAYNAENTANKTTNLDTPDNTTYPTTLAVKNYVDSRQVVTDNTTISGAGTSISPIKLAFNAEHESNKTTNLDTPDNTTYPTTLAVKNYVDSHSSSGDIYNFTAAKDINQLEFVSLDSTGLLVPVIDTTSTVFDVTTISEDCTQTIVLNKNISSFRTTQNSYIVFYSTSNSSTDNTCKFRTITVAPDRSSITVHDEIDTGITSSYGTEDIIYLDSTCYVIFSYPKSLQIFQRDDNTNPTRGPVYNATDTLDDVKMAYIGNNKFVALGRDKKFYIFTYSGLEITNETVTSTEVVNYWHDNFDIIGVSDFNEVLMGFTNPSDGKTYIRLVDTNPTINFNAVLIEGQMDYIRFSKNTITNDTNFGFAAGKTLDKRIYYGRINIVDGTTAEFQTFICTLPITYDSILDCARVEDNKMAIYLQVNNDGTYIVYVDILTGAFLYIIKISDIPDDSQWSHNVISTYPYATDKRTAVAVTDNTHNGMFYETTVKSFGGSTTKDNRDTFIGINKNIVSAGHTTDVYIGGAIVDGFSNLEPGKTYYLDENGNLTTNSTNNVRVGKAITNTKLKALY